MNSSNQLSGHMSVYTVTEHWLSTALSFARRITRGCWLPAPLLRRSVAQPAANLVADLGTPVPCGPVQQPRNVMRPALGGEGEGEGCLMADARCRGCLSASAHVSSPASPSLSRECLGRCFWERWRRRCPATAAIAGAGGSCQRPGRPALGRGCARDGVRGQWVSFVGQGGVGSRVVGGKAELR